MRLAVLLGVLWAGGAWAQLVSEDFESGSFDAGWSLVSVTPQVSLVPSTLAAHRGSWGARCEDRETSRTLVASTSLERRFQHPGADLYYRLWFRMPGWSGQGGTSIFGLYGQQGPEVGTYNSFGTDYRSALFQVVQPITDAGTVGYLNVQSEFVLADAGWVLLEGASWGVGSWNLESVMVANGTELARTVQQPMPTAGDAVVIIGDIFQHSGTGFAAVLDFDDLAVSSTPLPGRVAVVQDGFGTPGACVPLLLELRSNIAWRDGGEPGPIPAPYAVGLVVDAGVPLFADLACRTAASALTLGKGLRKVPVYVRVPDGGTVVVEARHGDAAPDFLPGRATFDLTAAPVPDPDPGSPLATRRLAVGCGCAGADGHALAGLGLLLVLLARRRSALRGR